ncbi:Zinc finger, RING/FYVE/PHD-type [Artemisia annua]|uniref:Zinc finger, RING/FYVE/PHD-type n=1 Tax=Artemisia annua TaxID=35608 RepID=A0A2U1LHZ0_ARTAN|nr:Zinc finger, RING/FYVE/PHD-type [Artemisia annua]
MGSRVNEKGKAPVSCSPLIEENKDAANGFSFLDGDLFDSFDDMKLLLSPGWEKYHQDVAQCIPESSGSFMDPEMNTNSFQNSQVSLSPDFENLDWNSQCLNLGQSAISAGLMNDGPGVGNLDNLWSSNTPTIGRNFGGESNIGSSNRPRLNLDIGDIGGSSSQFHRRDSTPVHPRNGVDLNSSQYGVQGKDEGSFLSLGIGGNEEATSGYQPNSRETSDKLKEAALAELKLARVRRLMDQGSDADLMGIQRNISGIFNQSNQFSHMDQMTPTNSSRSMQNVIPRNITSGNLDQYRLIVGNQVGHSGTLGGNSAPFLNSQQLNMNNVAPELAMTSWVNSYRHSGQVQDSRLGNDVSSSLGLGSGSIPANYAGQFSSQRAMPMPTQDLISQRTMAPQVGWVSSGQADRDGPFPKRLGVELSGRDSPQAARRLMSPTGTNLQATSTGQTRQFLHKQSTRLADHLRQPSIDRIGRAPVSYPMNSQEPFAHGLSQNAVIQLPKDPRVATSTNATTADGHSRVNPYQKRTAAALHPSWRTGIAPGPPLRTAVAPHPPLRTAVAPHQRQKIINPTIHRSMPAPAIPVPTAPVCPSIPVGSHTQQPAGSIRSSKPGASSIRPRAPPATAAGVVHIKALNTTPKLSGYKCLLCKRDLALTSEGAVFQPSVPPPVAVLPCGHTFHDQCLENITPKDQAKDPPCIPCAIGEN